MWKALSHKNMDLQPRTIALLCLIHLWNMRCQFYVVWLRLVWIFLKVILTRLMDYNMFSLRLHSIAHILYRACMMYSRPAFPTNRWINKHLPIVEGIVIWLHLRKDYLLRAFWSYGRRRRRYTSQGILLWWFKKTDNHQNQRLARHGDSQVIGS